MSPLTHPEGPVKASQLSTFDLGSETQAHCASVSLPINQTSADLRVVEGTSEVEVGRIWHSPWHIARTRCQLSPLSAPSPRSCPSATHYIHFQSPALSVSGDAALGVITPRYLSHSRRELMLSHLFCHWVFLILKMEPLIALPFFFLSIFKRQIYSTLRTCNYRSKYGTSDDNYNYNVKHRFHSHLVGTLF